jgi:hypothetical protein
LHNITGKNKENKNGFGIFWYETVDVVSFGRKYFCNAKNVTKIIIQ